MAGCGNMVFDMNFKPEYVSGKHKVIRNAFGRTGNEEKWKYKLDKK